MTLSVEHLTTTFPSAKGRVPIVDDVSFSVEPGKCIALVGESGSGKSMTALSMLRLVPRPGRVDAGRVLLGGTRVDDLPVPLMRKVRGKKIGMIFQEPMTALNPVVRVGDQVNEAILLHEKVTRANARARGLAMFERVGIPDPSARYDAYPHQLSGGLKQRVMIAMALVMKPEVLIADEPTTALDVTIQAQIIELLRELQRDSETTVVLITHDLGVVNQLADEVLVLYAGRIVERGDRVRLLSEPLHPYSEGLLRALPGHNTRGERLHEIPGTVPSPADWLSGCRFRDRCLYAEPRCAEAAPPETAGRTGTRLSCYVRGAP